MNRPQVRKSITVNGKRYTAQDIFRLVRRSEVNEYGERVIDLGGVKCYAVCWRDNEANKSELRRCHPDYAHYVEICRTDTWKSVFVGV